MANSNGWGDGASNNSIGWGQGANNAIAWGDSHAKSWAGATDIVGITTDPDAQAFITAAAITDPTQQTAIDALVKGMKADGLWTKMKAVYPFVGGTASTHKWNLKDPRDLDAAFRLVFNGGWTHSANGATPNGTNGYADTFLVPSSVLSQNNASLGYYGGNDTGAIVNKSAMGSIRLAPNRVFAIEPAYPSLGLFGDVNDGSNTSTSNTNTSGFIFASRNSSTEKIHSIRGTQTVKNELSVGIPTSKVALGARNSNGSIQNYSAIQHRFTFISEGFNTTEAANLYTRVQAFQTALSRQV